MFLSSVICSVGMHYVEVKGQGLSDVTYLMIFFYLFFLLSVNQEGYFECIGDI